MIQPDTTFKSSRQLGQDLNEDYTRRRQLSRFHIEPAKIIPPNEKIGEQC